MKYRGRMDIAAAILRIAEGGSKKTRIMYLASISYPQLKEYLAVLTDRGLLEYVKEERIYSTTDRGRRFLKMYEEAGRMMPGINMMTKAV
jgi:predicted transcriptional regulator